MMRPRLLQVVVVVVATFAVISAGVLLAWLYAPTTSAARHIAFEGTMFAVTGATLAAGAVICGRRLE